MSRQTTLCIARHGETDWNSAGILQGWTDVPLNSRGRTQAAELAASLVDEPFVAIYTSPLQRASETAAIVAALLKLPQPFRHEGLKERCFGIVQGVPKAELLELNPVLYQQLLRRNPACEFEEGEDMDEFATRVLDGLTDIARTHPGARLLAITHGWVMDVITRHVMDLPRSSVLNLKRKNGERIWIDASAQGLRMHLPQLSVASD